MFDTMEAGKTVREIGESPDALCSPHTLGLLSDQFYRLQLALQPSPAHPPAETTQQEPGTQMLTSGEEEIRKLAGQLQQLPGYRQSNAVDSTVVVSEPATDSTQR